MKKHKHIFHADDTGEEKGRTTKLSVEHASTVSSRAVCASLAVTTVSSLYLHRRKKERQEF